MADEERKDIGERLARIETLLELNNRDLFSRVKKVEDNQMWLYKLVFGAIVTGSIALIFK
jgi:hypothetical protein